MADHNRRGKFGVSSVTMPPLDFAMLALEDIANGHIAPWKLAAVVHAEINRFLNGQEQSFPPRGEFDVCRTCQGRSINLCHGCRGSGLEPSVDNA